MRLTQNNLLQAVITRDFAKLGYIYCKANSGHDVNDFFTLSLQHQLVYSYSWPLVGLSLILAIAGSCLAVWQSLLLKDITNKASKSYIRFSGAIALAGGVWSMHFVGMLAFSVTTQVTYNIPITLLSILPAVVAGFWAEKWLANPNQDAFKLLTHALVLGSGIGLMHYIGMEAMVMHATRSYEPTMFIASIIIAVLVSALTLLMLQRMHNHAALSEEKYIGVGGVGLGLAISCMHYVGMSASRFSGAAEFTIPMPADDYLFLTSLVFLVATLTIVIAYSASLISRVRHQVDAIALQGRDIEAILAHAMSPIVTTNENGQIQTFNSPFQRLIDQTESVIKGKSIALFIPELTGRFNQHGPKQWEIECEANALDNVESLQIKANRFARDDDMIWVVSITDITEFSESKVRRAQNTNFDPLTGAYNRLYFDIQMPREIELAKLKRHPLSLLMIDIDHFESIAAKLGQEAGDDLIQRTAESLRQCIKITDYLFRFGGQKFIVILSETDSHNANQCAEIMRKSTINALSSNIDSESCSLSIGIYSADDLQFETAQMMLNRANEALLLAINNGRNRHVLYGEKGNDRAVS